MQKLEKHIGLDSTGIPVPVEFGPVPVLVELAGTRPVPHFFHAGLLDFYVLY